MGHHGSVSHAVFVFYYSFIWVSALSSKYQLMACHCEHSDAREACDIPYLV